MLAIRRLLWLWTTLACSGEVVDRIAVTVGSNVITDGEIRLQIRIAALLDRKQPDLSAPERRKAAERMVDQMLLLREEDGSRFPEPAMTDIVQELAGFQKDHYSNEAELQHDLQERQIPEDDLRRYLQVQLRTLRFIEFRFRAGVQVTEQEMQTYYQKEFLPSWKEKDPARKEKDPPPFDQVSSDIEEILISRQVDANTEEWLAQARKLTPVRYREEAFR
jgi:peptidyl-prolyl cis-trans isomerase SurA